MWKHVVVAASFDQAWATVNPVTGVAQVAPSLTIPDISQAGLVVERIQSSFAGIPGEVGTTAVGDAMVTSTGASGTLTVTTPQVDYFMRHVNDNTDRLAGYFASQFPGLPREDVTVTCDPLLTTTVAPTQPVTTSLLLITAAPTAAPVVVTQTTSILRREVTEAPTAPPTTLAPVTTSWVQNVVTEAPTTAAPTAAAQTTSWVHETEALTEAAQATAAPTAAPTAAAGATAAGATAAPPVTTVAARRLTAAATTTAAATAVATAAATPAATAVGAAAPTAAATAAPAAATGGAAATAAGTGVVAGVVTVPSVTDTPPGHVNCSFTVVLSPGASEISAGLAAITPAEVLTNFNTPFWTASGAGVSAAAIAMGDADATGVTGHFAVSVTNVAAFSSTTNGAALRTMVASLSRVDPADVAFTGFAADAATPAVTVPTTTAAAAQVGPAVEARRLTGTVDATFRIEVPGHRARGWKKDCSLQKVGVPAMTFSSTDGISAAQATASQATPAACAQSTSVCAGVGCNVWSWTTDDNVADSGICTFSNLDIMQVQTYNANAITQFVSGAEGHDACGACPAVSPEDLSAWPGNSAEASHAAFATLDSIGTGRQPLNLQCWPKNDAFDLMPCGFTVLEDTASPDRPWTGRCNNLVATPETLQADCSASCVGDPFCTVWMWANNGADPPVAQCYRGQGSDCWTQSTSATVSNVLASQRIQHGQVNVVIADLGIGMASPGVVAGLQQQFAENVGAADGGGVTFLATADAQRVACRNICHSNILCSYWQSFFNTGLTAGLGCFTENPGVDATGGGGPGGFVAYPLTTADFTEGAELASLTGGQFIMHGCAIPQLPGRPPVPTTTTTAAAVAPVAPAVAATPIVTAAPAAGSWWWPWGFILLMLIVVLIVVLLLAYLFCQPEPKKRAIKPVKKKEVPPPPAAPLVQTHNPLMQMVAVQHTVAQPLAMHMVAPQATFPAHAVAQPMHAVAQPMHYAQPH